MGNVNNFGGGLSPNLDKPVEHYKIIDRRIDSRKVTRIEDKSVNNSKIESYRKEVFSNTLKKINNSTKSSNNLRSLSGKGLRGVKEENSNKLSGKTNNLSDKTGTNIALNNIAKQLTDQFYGLLWTKIAEGVNQNPEGGFGEEMFRKILWPEMIKLSSGEELDDLGKAIVRELEKKEDYDGRQKK